MWICTKCGQKNNNSSLNCHGESCKEERHYDGLLQANENKGKKIKQIYDFCPKCHKDTIWDAARFRGKKAWRCTNCHKLAFLIGKPKPFPVEITNEVLQE